MNSSQWFTRKSISKYTLRRLFFLSLFRPLREATIEKHDNMNYLLEWWCTWALIYIFKRYKNVLVSVIIGNFDYKNGEGAMDLHEWLTQWRTNSKQITSTRRIARKYFLEQSQFSYKNALQILRVESNGCKIKNKTRTMFYRDCEIQCGYNMSVFVIVHTFRCFSSFNFLFAFDGDKYRKARQIITQCVSSLEL